MSGIGLTHSPYKVEPAPAGSSTADFIVDSHLLHVYEIECSCCHHITKVSEVFEVHIHRARQQVRRLIPAPKLAPGKRMDLVHLPKRHIPICVYCVDTKASSGDVASVERLQSEHEWAQTLRRKYAPGPVAPPPGQVRPPSTTLPPRPVVRTIPSATDL